MNHRLATGEMVVPEADEPMSLVCSGGRACRVREEQAVIFRGQVLCSRHAYLALGPALTEGQLRATELLEARDILHVMLSDIETRLRVLGYAPKV